MLSLSTVQKVLQNLLIEGVAIRDMRTIIDTLLEDAARVQDPSELTALVRVALGRSIVQQIYGSVGELPVIALDQSLERLLMQTCRPARRCRDGTRPCRCAARTHPDLNPAAGSAGASPVLLTPVALRPLLARFLRRTVPQLKVLSHLKYPKANTSNHFPGRGAA